MSLIMTMPQNPGEVQTAFETARNKRLEQNDTSPCWLVCTTPISYVDDTPFGDEEIKMLSLADNFSFSKDKKLIGNDNDGFFPIQKIISNHVKQVLFPCATEVWLGDIYDLNEPFEDSKLSFDTALSV